MKNYDLFLESKGISEDIIKFNEKIYKRALGGELEFETNFIYKLIFQI
jgi:hypothetical protein